MHSKRKLVWTFLAGPLAAGFLCFAAQTPSARAEEGGADKKTGRMWKAKCASCHGEDGKGQTEQGTKMGIGDMTKPEFWKDITDEKFNKTVNDGLKRKKNGKDQEMKPMKDQLKPADIDALRAFARALKH